MAAPRPPQAPAAPPGWYPDPDGSGRARYWDGGRWTDALAPQGAPGADVPSTRDPSRIWALAAHLSALLSLTVGFTFVGPLVVYLVRPEDPFVRRHAAEALNFNLSFMIYALVLGVIAVVLMIVLVGVLLVPLLILLGLGWLVLVVIATVKAGQGQDHRYPLTIRFVG